MNKSILNVFLLFAFISISLNFGSIAFSQTVTSNNSMPKWLRTHMEYMTEGSGRWVTDNSNFKSVTEPFDKYITEWGWGIGKQSIKGRLFALQNKKETGNFWEFQLFWHPTKRKAVLQQFGGNGIVGVGEMQNVAGSKEIERKSEMIFHNPDGTTLKNFHKIVESSNEHQTISFLFKDGNWQKQRRYIWRREPKREKK